MLAHKLRYQFSNGGLPAVACQFIIKEILMSRKSSLAFAAILIAFGFSATTQAGEVSQSVTLKQGSQAVVNASTLKAENLIAREGGCRRRCGA